MRRKSQKRAATGSLNLGWRRLLFESLEERRVLAGGYIPQSVQDTLSTNLANVINSSLAPTAKLPIIGSALKDNPNFVKSQVAALIDDLDTASVTPGAVTVTPGLTTSFAVNRLIQSHGKINVPISLDLGVMTVGSPDPNDKVANAHASMYFYVDIYYRLNFNVDALTGTTTFLDVPISGLQSRLWTPVGGDLFNGHGLDVDAPDSPLAIVISGFTSTDFEVAGSMGGTFDATVYDVFWQKLNANQPFSIDDRTWMTTTIDASMGNWSTGPSGGVPPVITAHLNGEAHANLEAHLKMSKPLEFNVTARLDADWIFNDVLLTPGLPMSQLGDLPHVDVLDVTVDLDSSLVAAGYILDSIQSVTNSAPVATVISMLDTDLPIIGRSILEIAEASGQSTAGWADAISALKYINSLHVPGQQTGGTINLGSFRINNPLTDPQIELLQAGNGAPQAVDNWLTSLFGATFNTSDFDEGLHFWFLEDPMNVLFPAMAGKDRTLVTFTIPEIDFSFGMNEVFDLFGSFELFDDFPGVSASGGIRVQLDAELGYDTAGLKRMRMNQSPEADDAKYGLYIDGTHTYFKITAGMGLNVGGDAPFSVSGGIYGAIEVVPVGYLDDTNMAFVRPGHLLNDATKIVQAYGNIYADARFSYPGGSSAPVDHVSIIDLDLPGFDTETYVVGDNHTIGILKTNTSEKIFVFNQRLDVTSDRPIFGSPNQYNLVITVRRDDLTDYYKIARYVKQSDGSYAIAETYNWVGLVDVSGPTFGANYKDIHTTIIVDDLKGGGTAPVDAVILGGNGIDTLKYYGTGNSVIVGGRGNDTIRALPITGTAGSTLIISDYVDAANPAPNLFNLPQSIMDQIVAAATPLPPAGPPGEDDDEAPEDPGKNKVVSSTNAKVIDVQLPDAPPGGGSGAGGSSLASGADGDGGTATASFIELVSAAPVGTGGFISGSDYQLYLRAAIGTPTSTGTLDLSTVSTPNGAALRAVGTQISLTAVGVPQFFISSFGGSLHIADLAALPGLAITVANQVGSPGTSTVIDGPASGASNLDISHDDNIFGELLVTGALAYASIQFLGLSHRDQIRIKNGGGTVSVDDLTGAGVGDLTIDNSGRTVGSTTAANLTINNSSSSMWVLPDADPNNVRVWSAGGPSVLIVDHRSIDRVALNLTGTDAGQHSAFIDASLLKGTLDIAATGPAAASNEITLAKVGTGAVVTVDGGLAQTKLDFGRNYLSEIKRDVTATKVELHIDNIGATDARVMTIAPTNFRGWDAGGGLTPTLFYSQLQRTLTVDAGGGDVYLLDGTPTSITNTVLNSKSDVRSRIYSDNWQVGISANDDWAIYLGQRISANGTVTRTKHLAGLSNVSVALDFKTGNAAATDVVIDGDLDAPGAHYTVGGAGGLGIVNDTVHLSVAIGGYRTIDQAYVYMPGAVVDANLQYAGVGKLYFDGQARLAGTNTTASNSISIKARYGQTTMTPLSQYNSLIDMYTDVYILGSMPQDALNVSVPTNVVIAAGQASQFNLHLNPDSYADVSDGAGSLVSWLTGPRPTDSGGFFVLPNVDSDEWSTYFAPGAGHGTPPNPFAEQPYGIVMPHLDAPLSVTYSYYQIVNGVRTLVHSVFSGTGRFWTVDENPVAVDNDVHLNASQLRGTFNFNVSGPDYDYIRLLARESLHSGTSPSVSYNAPFYTWGSAYNLGRIAFGQSNIVLADVNPQLSVSVDSANRNYTYPELTFVNLNSEVIRSAYPVTSLNVGGGKLANIQGNVNVQNVAATIDDSAGISANNLILTTTQLGTWTTSGGTTQPKITFGPLDKRVLKIVAGTSDRVGIEGVPLTASLTSIETGSDSGAPVNVYLMGRNATSSLRAVGNINLFVGRRLNADGSVTKVGNVAGVLGPNNQTVPISFQFTGSSGHGQLIYDASTTAYGGTGSGQMALLPAPGDPTKQALYFNNSVNYLLFGSNIDVEYDEPVLVNSNVTSVIDERLNGAVHYVANSTGVASNVRVTTAYGPVQIDGRGQNTSVEIIPATVTVMGLASIPPGNDLMTTILAPIMVSNAMLAIRPDTSSTPAPTQPKNIVIDTNQITGIAGAAIQFSNLKDTPARGYVPALIVQMPRYASNLTVTGTPAGVTTAPRVIGQSVINTVVTGASGRLSFGTFDGTSNYQTVDSGQDINYATQSLTIGNGTVQTILGEVLIGPTGLFSSTNGIVIDDRNDTTSRNVTFKPSAATGAPTIAGLSAGSIGLKQAPGGLTVYSGAASHWTMQSIESLGPATMYAGLGTIVDLAGPVSTFANSFVIPRWQIVGAGTVRLNPGSGAAKVSSAQFPVIKADPARPTDVTQLIVDHTNANVVFFDDNSVPAGVLDYLQVLDIAPDGFGRLRLGSSTNLQTEVEYQLGTTQLTLTGGRISSEQINVLDTGPLKTTINPNFSQVNVLGTTGPLEILQPAVSSPARVFLGNAGNLQGLHGDITLRGDNAALPTLQTTLDMSAESSAHTVTVSNVSGTQTDISGIAPVAIHLIGSLLTTSLKGGSGNNTLIGPDATNSWVVNAANGGSINGTKYSFSGFRSLTGGSGADTFRFTTTGSLTANLDGGPGTDTLTYDNSATWHTLPYDLAHGIAPLVGGTASHLEIVPIGSTSLGNQTNYVYDVVSIAPLSIIGGLGNFTFTATGLPVGLSINPSTGLVTGTIAPQPSGNRTVHISATDGSNGQSTDFTWSVHAFALTNPGTQTTAIGGTVNLALTATGVGTLTYSASNLPAGLSIDSQSGVISGSIAAQLAGNRTVTVSASDGIEVSSANFVWSLTFHSLTQPSDLSYAVGGTIVPLSISHNALVPLTWSAQGLPNGLTINAQTGVISGTIVNQSGAVGHHSITVTATDGFNARSTGFSLDVTGFGLLDPGTIVSASEAAISLQIQSVGQPANTGYTATGLPAGLSISNSGLITGTIDPANMETGVFHVHVVATDGNVTADVHFDWRVIAFSIDSPGNQFIPEGAPIAIQLPITNLQHETLQFTVTGGNGNFYVDDKGELRGNFNVTTETTGLEQWQMTVVASDGFASDQTTFTVTTYDGFYAGFGDDKASYAGSIIDMWFDVYSPYGQTLTESITGLPGGLTMSPEGSVQGVISASAVGTHHVTIQVTNNTLNDADGPGGPDYTYTYNFDWRVVALPTAAQLNAGTPQGSPELVTVLEPSNSESGPSQFNGVTYGSGPSQHNVVYFTSDNKLWQVVNGVTSIVPSIEPSYSALPKIYGFARIDGHGLILNDENSRMWFVDESGARLLTTAATYWYDSLQTVDGVVFGAGVTDDGSGSYPSVFLKITFDASGEPSISFSPNTGNTSIVGSFAGGAVGMRGNGNNTQSMYWMNVTTGETRLLATTSQDGSFYSVFVGDGAGGTTTLFMIEYDSGFGYRARAINSADLASPSPSPTPVVNFPLYPVFHGFPTLVGGKLVYGTAAWNGTANVISFTVNDGTLAGTRTYTSPLIADNMLSTHVYATVVVGNDLYVLFQTPFTVLDETTLVYQLLKFDTVTGAFTNAVSLYGTNNYYYGPSWLTASDSGVYFTARSDESLNNTLWSYDPVNGLKVVESYANNPYSDPQSLAFIDGSLYFSASSTAVLNLQYNQPSQQAWILRPATQTPSLPGDFNQDGKVDAADYVMWRKLGLSNEDYQLWRQNFGRTLDLGGGSATAEAADAFVGSSSASSTVAQDTSVPYATAAYSLFSAETEEAPSQQRVMAAPDEGGSIETSALVQEVFGFNNYVHEMTLNSIGKPRFATLNPSYRDSSLSETFRNDDLLALYQRGNISRDRVEDVTELVFAVRNGDSEPISDGVDALAIDDAFAQLSLTYE